ncbi:hypothetical protein LJC74_08880 [Eubacteriales bacterium OttesenSCG-928-A19]|nr:hypothetical protein [Eubacteriales bacterium OttesenSCG-928-A19]
MTCVQPVRTARWLCCALLCLCLCLLAGAGTARALPEGTMLYDGAGEPVQASVKPLDDGTLLVQGTAYYPGTERDHPNVHYDGGFIPPVNQGYLARLGTDGKPRWTLRMGEHLADNSLNSMGEMPDGRHLVHLFLYETTMGSQHFIVNMDNGRIEEMLPTVEVALLVPPLTLFMTREGYVGGGWLPVDDTFNNEQYEDPRFSHFDGRTVRYLEWDLSVRWELDLDPYTGVHDNDLVELANGDILIYGYTWEGEYDSGEWSSSALRVDRRTGEVRWSTGQDDIASGRELRYLDELPDGSLLFLRDYYGGAEGSSPTILCLDEGGAYQWEKPIAGADGALPWTMDSRPVRMGERYVACAKDGADQRVVLRFDADGLVDAELPLLPPDDAVVVDYTRVSSSASGEYVYVYGRLRAPDDNSFEPSEYQTLFYLRLTEGLFEG